MTLPVLPSKMRVELPWESVYPLGYHRPGNCAPWTVPVRPGTCAHAEPRVPEASIAAASE